MNTLKLNIMSVLIIGSGLAGLITGLVAVQNRKDVIIFEKMKTFGGNSIKASSGINLINSATQIKLGIHDRSEEFINDTLRSCRGINYDGEYNTDLVQLLSKYSDDVENLLLESDVVLDQVVLCGGHSIARTHSNKSTPGFGYYLTKKILDRYILSGGKIIYNANVRELLTENAGIIGIRLENNDVYLGKVVIATGGYERSTNLLPKELIDTPTTAGIHCNGDGIMLGLSVGADLIGMKHIQLHPTGIINPSDRNNMTKFLAPEILRGIGGKLYSLDNNYIGHELEARDKLTQIIQRQNNKIAKIVLDQECQSKIPALLDFYKSKGLCIVDDENLIFEVTPVIHYTMGGLSINIDGQVLNKYKIPIPGLYAVGEVTGGVHGANRLAGNSLLECCVFGIIVGKNI